MSISKYRFQTINSLIQKLQASLIALNQVNPVNIFSHYFSLKHIPLAQFSFY